MSFHIENELKLLEGVHFCLTLLSVVIMFVIIPGPLFKTFCYQLAKLLPHTHIKFYVFDFYIL